MNEVTALNDKYGLPARVVFRDGEGGLPFVDLFSETGRVVISLRGGQLINWTSQDGGEVIWLSPQARFAAGNSIRGGVPVCWPWFGAHPQQDSFPAHGFARTAPWEVLSSETSGDENVSIEMKLVQGDATRGYWPYPSDLAVRVSLGDGLKLELVTHNTGATPFTIGEALHTYFKVSDVRKVVVNGLDGCQYLDKVDGYARKRQVGAVTFDGETDRIYVDSGGDCVIEDPGLHRRIRISKHGSRSTVVWNPWAEKGGRLGDLGADGYLNMVCVESGNAADNRVSIAPGDEHRLAVTYRIERLDGR